MPVMDGMELLSRAKGEETLKHIPIIMLTARQSVDVKLEALRIGVDDYLTKPFREEELKARVANLIKNSQNRALLIPSKSSENSTKPTASPFDLQWLQEIEILLLENVDNPKFKLTDIAPQMNLSYRRLQQKIKFITGLTLKSYQRSIKLAKAREVLKSGTVRTVKEVMYSVGFEQYSHFSKLYEAEFGIKPIEDLKG